MAAPPILSLRDVRLADGPRALFEGADLALEPGARACLVGRNGAGKSTLLRLLAGISEPDEGERFLQPGVRVAFASQEPAINGATLLDYATETGAAAHEAERALQAFGVDPGRPTTGLSGGESRRAALARAFASAPDVLLLDEPTNHLDILAIETLEVMVGRTRAAVLIVSHDRAFLERATRQVFWLENRRIRRMDESFRAFPEWAERVEAEEAEVDRRLGKALAREQYWLERGVTGRRARNEGRRRKLLALRAEKADRMRLARGELKGATTGGAATSGKKVIEAKNLVKRFGDRTLIDRFSTRVLRGDRVAIVGPNGAGKTTLIKILLGELEPDAGSVSLGANLEIAYIDQARADLSEGMSLKEALAPLGGDQIMVQGRPRHVAGYAKDFLFRDEQLRQPVSSLSGGERNRLLLARALARLSNLMVLDEPTNDLDLETLDLLEEVLSDYEGTLLLVSHDRDFIDRLATSTISLDGRGRIVETPGGWSDFVSQNPGFLSPPPVPESKRTPAARPSAPTRATKLSFKDQHALKTLEARIEALPREIAALEARLADPALFTRDPAAFAKLSADLERVRGELEAAEIRWLDLEMKREALGA